MGELLVCSGANGCLSLCYHDHPHEETEVMYRTADDWKNPSCRSPVECRDVDYGVVRCVPVEVTP